MWANRGIPRDLEGESKHLKKWQSAFWRKGDVMVQVWKDRKTNMEIKKPYAVAQYNKFMKGIDGADQYLSFYSVLRTM
jgi:hypothetical protein